MLCSARKGNFLHGAELMEQSLSGAKSRWEQTGARSASSVPMPDRVRPNHVLWRICHILGSICLCRKMLLLLCDWSVKILPPRCSTGICLALWLAMDKTAAKWNSELRKCWMLFSPRSKMFKVSWTQVSEHKNSHGSATQLLFPQNYWGSDFEKARLQFLEASGPSVMKEKKWTLVERLFWESTLGLKESWPRKSR